VVCGNEKFVILNCHREKFIILIFLAVHDEEIYFSKNLPSFKVIQKNLAYHDLILRKVEGILN
jgi:hypothetical protein